MENYKLDNDIHLFCVRADSFPDGIIAAQENLKAVSKDEKRNHFGISFLYDGEILYMAGQEMMQDEQIPAGCEKYLLKKGNYISFYIKDFANNISQIEKAFKILTDDPRIDENGCCVECYLPGGTSFELAKDVRCMVRLADQI